MKIEDYLKELKTGKITVAYFSHSGCSVCKVLKPKVRELSDSFATARFLYIDTEVSGEVCGSCSVFAVPTVIVYAEDKEIKRFSRNFGIEEIHRILTRYDSILNEETGDGGTDILKDS